MSARFSLTLVVAIAAIAFGGWRLLAPQAQKATEAAGESAHAVVDTVSRAHFTGAEASLAAQRSATGSYAGARLQPPVRLVRADESSFCIQLDRPPLQQHMNGPGEHRRPVHALDLRQPVHANRSRQIGEYPPMRRAALVTLCIAVPYTAGGLWLDRSVGHTGQLLLGLLTAAILAGLLTLHSRAVRLQTLAVVGIATLGEVVGSLIWGLYSYRLDNLPAFVPPGHGLVFLCGVSLATLFARRPAPLLAVAIAGASVWGFLGITVLPALDLAGAIGCAFLAAVLMRTRRTVYAGVFLAVAALELYGTAVGTWTWQTAVPGLGIAQGNPPSGAASGYVFFDVVALWLITRVRRSTLRRIQTRVQAFATGIQRI